VKSIVLNLNDICTTVEKIIFSCFFLFKEKPIIKEQEWHLYGYTRISMNENRLPFISFNDSSEVINIMVIGNIRKRRPTLV
jgi:hypothetical protein